jgi:hypothetical protein
MFLANAPISLLIVFLPLQVMKTIIFVLLFTALGHRKLAVSLLEGLAWNIAETRSTLRRRRTRPGRAGWSWLYGRLAITPAVITHLLRNGLPKFEIE